MNIQTRKRHLFILCLLITFIILIVYLHLAKNGDTTIRYTVYERPGTSTVTSKPISKDVSLFSGRAGISISKSKNISGNGNLLNECGNISNFQSIANITFSRLTLVENGDIVIVMVQTYDENNVRRTHGGDLIIIWANETKTGSTVAGEVVDQGNGTYIGYIKVLWTGYTVVKARLISFREDACRLNIARERYGNGFFAIETQWSIHGYFKKEGRHEKETYNEDTLCSAVPILPGFTQICNLTALNGNVPYYCGRPRHKELNCNDLVSFGTHYFKADYGFVEKVKSRKNDETVIKQTLAIGFNKTTKEEWNMTTCAKRPSELSWTDPQPPGYWTGTEWRLLNCKGPKDLTIEKYRTCLKSKHLYVIGDSTARQYAKYMIKDVLDLGEVDLKNKLGENGRIFHDYTIYTNYNISVCFKKHEMPFHNTYFPARGISSVFDEIQKIANSDIEDDTILLIVNYHAHLTYFPPSAFQLRIKRLAHALTHFFVKKPKAKVFFKGNALYNSWQDQYLVFKQIIFQEFLELRTKVTYLDDWSVTVAHDNRDLHPVGIVMDSEIQQLMAYICEF